MVDWIPVISQVKSLIQVIAGDEEGAKRTQENFVNQCPVVSQAVSLAEVIVGEPEAAAKRQGKFFKGVANMADGIPVVGHVKGIGHYVCGDEEGGDRAMKSASRTTIVMGAGAGAFLVGGPVGAVAAGVASGTAFDGAATIVEDEPQGVWKVVDQIIDSDEELDAGDVIDGAAGLFFDGLTGYSGGRIAKKAQANANQKQVYRVARADEAGRAVKQQKVQTGYNQSGPRGETWVSDAPKEHSRGYMADQKANNPGADIRTYKAKVGRGYYDKMETIDQRGSGRINTPRTPASKMKNVTNTERLAGTGKKNLGIKGDHNLSVFNEHVQEVRECNVNHWKYTNDCTKAMFDYGRGVTYGSALGAARAGASKSRKH